jgi:predicted NBD/HSP70 family sugar kinase
VTQSAARGKARTPEYEIEIHPSARGESRKGQKFAVGIELASAHLRVAVLPMDARPSLAVYDPLERAGFFAVGYHPWSFEAERGMAGQYQVAEETMDAVLGVLREFLGQVGIDQSNVDRIRAGAIVAFDPFGRAVRVDTSALEGKLAVEFNNADVGGGNRTNAALLAELSYGAAVELRPADRVIYVTVSRNINLDAFPGGMTADAVFARGVRHAEVDQSTLAQLCGDWLGSGYLPPEPRKCPTCSREFCLHSIASGQGMVDQVAEDATAVAAVRSAAAMRRKGYAEDRGARIQVNGDAIDSSSIFKAASFDETCRRLVLQAGIAIGITIFEKIINVGLFDPDLIVIGGTVPVGMKEEDQRPLSQRLTIDGILQRTLRSLLIEDLPFLRVTRSRFAGFTGLLGLTVAGLDIV